MKFSMIAAVAVASLASAAAVTAQQVVVEPTVTVGSTEPTPESPAIARKEAAAALAQAKHDCRKEQDKSAQQSCLTQAHDDYNQMMASAHAR
jgi:hypothetical protein